MFDDDQLYEIVGQALGWKTQPLRDGCFMKIAQAVERACAAKHQKDLDDLHGAAAVEVVGARHHALRQVRDHVADRAAWAPEANATALALVALRPDGSLDVMPLCTFTPDHDVEQAAVGLATEAMNGTWLPFLRGAPRAAERSPLCRHGVPTDAGAGACAACNAENWHAAPEAYTAYPPGKGPGAGKVRPAR